MIDSLRSRFSIMGVRPSEGPSCADRLREEFSIRHWDQNPVVAWERARRRLVVEFELEIGPYESDDAILLTQFRELSDCLLRSLAAAGRLSIEVEDFWISEERDPFKSREAG